MRRQRTVKMLCGGMLLTGLAQAAPDPYPAWPRAGSICVLTTPEGANLPESASEEGFPLLVRLHHDFFDFSEAKANGDDLRFSTLEGVPLTYQVEEWDATNGSASVWVRLPSIRGNARQEIRVHWGRPDAVSESNGAAVFNESNGYLSVWHMNSPVRDETGSLRSVDVGTTPTTGVIGPARHLAGGQGVFGGDQIRGYPTGASSHSSEVWFRPEQPNGSVLAWGNEQARGKVVMQFRAPPHVNMDCYFSGANVRSLGALSVGQWVHVVHTYQQGDSRLYVNGLLDGVSKTDSAPLAIQSPARLWLGGWYDHYDFVGDLDEARVSGVVRSADWVRLQYENQKPLQTLVGPVVPSGNSFSVSPTQATVREGESVDFSATAGGAQKIYWILKRDGRETTVAVDRFHFTFAAGRVSGDQTLMLQFKAVGANETRIQDIPLTIQEDVPEPVFALEAPASWDGRETIEVVPRIANLDAMRAQGAGELNYTWTVSNLAVIKEVVPGKLVLRRAQNSGRLSVTATVDNGGKPVTQTTEMVVAEPGHEEWIARIPAPDERPEDNQFYARDDQNEGMLYCTGTLNGIADAVFLKLYADDKLIETKRAGFAADNSYALSTRLKAGLIRYRVEFGTEVGGRETVRHTATNLVCGDAYLIEGQSNALATDTSEKSPPETNEWIRSYGRPPEEAAGAPGNLWCNPVWKAENGEKAELGWWGMELAKQLLASQEVPIFILNGAVGGTRIDQHQRNAADPTNLATIYGRMLWRLRQARLTHGIRAVLWHQGESDQGADGPTGGCGWETYQPLFVELSAAWKQDFPNVRHYYVFQIWPDACSMGGRNGSGDRLREEQRNLPRLFSNLSIMSTLGIRPPGDCHFPLVGWAEFARLIQPLIERDLYGKVPAASITPPNLRHASYAGKAQDTIVLEFDQPVVWEDTLRGQFYLEGEKDRFASGSVSGHVLTLQLKEASTATRITYLKEVAWSQDTLLKGANGLAALTFCDVEIGPSRPGR
ncbi:MAG: DUF2341 domain-containing protein [Limisphaerales bacterium]